MTISLIQNEYKNFTKHTTSLSSEKTTTSGQFRVWYLPRHEGYGAPRAETRHRHLVLCETVSLGYNRLFTFREKPVNYQFLLESMAKHLIVIRDSVVHEIISFLEKCESGIFEKLEKKNQCF